MNAAEGWDDSWSKYPRMPGRKEALRRIQATILGMAPPAPLPRKPAAPEPATAETRRRPAAQQPPDLDDAPTLTLPKVAKQDGAQVHDEQTGANIRTRSWARPAAVVCCALLAAAAIALTANGARSYMSRRAYDAAVESCAQARRDVESAWRTPYAKTYRAALSIDAGQVKDPKTVQHLHALAGKDKGPAPLLACKTGDGREALESAAGRMREAAASRTRLNSRMAAGAGAVLASRDAKDLEKAKTSLAGMESEASRLLADSDGKVADNATRDGLQQAIDQAGQAKGDKAKAYQDAANALQAAIDRVNASVQARSQADQQAAAQAAQQRAQRQGTTQRRATTSNNKRESNMSHQPASNKRGGGSSQAPATPSVPQGDDGGFDWHQWFEEHKTPSRCHPGEFCPIG